MYIFAFNFENYSVLTFPVKMTLMSGRELSEEENGSSRMTKDVWEKLGDAVQAIFKRSPPLHFL